MKSIKRCLISSGLFMFCLLAIFSSSCKKFLDATPNQELATITTMQQLRALLDNPLTINGNYPFIGAIASDDYYVTDASYNSYNNAEAKSAYSWGLIQESAEPNSIWLLNYKRILSANTVLDHIEKVSGGGYSTREQNALKGEALFHRGYTFFQLSQIYSMSYSPAAAGALKGIPLKLTSDINEPVTRPLLSQVFAQVISDLESSVHLLPLTSLPLLRPNRAAAFAALSNVYLVMGEYSKALEYADSSLMIKDSLMDFNEMSLNAENVIPLYNKEILWHAELGITPLLNTSRLKVDSNFYRSCTTGDLRGKIYFKQVAGSSYTIKSNYNNYPVSGMFFAGIATDEMFLVKSECLARLNRPDEALQTLNQLLEKRYDKNSYIPFVKSPENSALDIILAERRKELCFRGICRWIDIRRLNEYDPVKISPQRKIAGQVYTLHPKSMHLAFLIPQSVIDHSKVEQNKR